MPLPSEIAPQPGRNKTMLTTLNILSLDQGKGFAFRDLGDLGLGSTEEGPTAGTARREGMAQADRRHALAVFAVSVLLLPLTTIRRRASS